MCCVLGLTEMSVKWLDNFLAESFFFFYSDPVILTMLQYILQCDFELWQFFNSGIYNYVFS